MMVETLENNSCKYECGHECESHVNLVLTVIHALVVSLYPISFPSVRKESLEFQGLPLESLNDGTAFISPKQ